MKAWRCWIREAPNLGSGIIATETAQKARYVVALSAADVGYLHKADPCLIACRRAPEYDDSLAVKMNYSISEGALSLPEVTE